MRQVRKNLFYIAELGQRTRKSFSAVGLSVLVEPPQVLLVLLPRDVARVGVEDDRVPLLARQLAACQLSAPGPRREVWERP